MFVCDKLSDNENVHFWYQIIHIEFKDVFCLYFFYRQNSFVAFDDVNNDTLKRWKFTKSTFLQYKINEMYYKYTTGAVLLTENPQMQRFYGEKNSGKIN